jgi:hypothetical protein
MGKIISFPAGREWFGQGEKEYLPQSKKQV